MKAYRGMTFVMKENSTFLRELFCFFLHDQFWCFLRYRIENEAVFKDVLDLKSWDFDPHGNFFLGGGWGSFFRVILMWLLEVQNVFLMINFDVWDRLGLVWSIFDIIVLWTSIFHWHILCENKQIWAFIRLL